jgi:hypothetical protein
VQIVFRHVAANALLKAEFYKSTRFRHTLHSKPQDQLRAKTVNLEDLSHRLTVARHSAYRAAALLLATATPATMAGVRITETGGYGAQLPFVEHEAENARFSGEVLGPSRRFGTIASEASGRKAVRLSKASDYLEFTLSAPANAVTVRYSLPDSADGRGLKATLHVEGAGMEARLPLTSEYSWYYGRYPFTNTPGDGLGHHMFDETRAMLGRTLPAGTVVRMRVTGAVPWAAIDVADFEVAPAATAAPQRSISILRFNADPSGRRSSKAAIEAAIQAARKRGVPVWIPPGAYRIDGHVAVDKVRILGAGPWHTVLRGDGIGFYGGKAPKGSWDVELSGFAMIGEVKERVDTAQLAAVGGSLSRSRISDLYLQHQKVGIWIDGPADDLRISKVRIVDQAADGVNFRRGVTNSSVENSFIRNTGDDGLAMWSHRDINRGNAFRNNTIVAPVLANGIAIYGGRDIEVSGNFVADTLTQGGGIHVGNRFDAVPVAGTISIHRNMLVRAGSFDPNWRFGVGALWFYALDAPITARIEVRGLEVRDATLPAIHMTGQPINGVEIEDVRVRGGSHVMQLQSPGTMNVRGLEASGQQAGGTMQCEPSFRLVATVPWAEWMQPAALPCGPLNAAAEARAIDAR